MLVPQWETTIEKLHNTIYGDGSISDNSDNDKENKVEVSDEYTSDYPGLESSTEGSDNSMGVLSE